jgi:hypothetical protein
MFTKNSMFSLPKSNPPAFDVKKDYNLQNQYENLRILEEIKNNQIEQFKQESISSKKQFYIILIIELINLILNFV